MTIETIRFPNGLRLLLDEMSHANSCTVHLCVASGLRYEQAGQAGISHMIEHMLFKGTATKSARQLAEAADDRGASMNAYTCKEYTSLYARSLPEHVPAMLGLLADMVRNSKLGENDLALERGVVIEEIAMYEDSPEDRAFDLFYESVWPDHPLGQNILGTRESLAALKPDDLRGHMARCYTPDRMVLSISGRFVPGEIKQVAEELFGDIPSSAPAAFELSPASFVAKNRFEAKTVEQNQLILAFPGCSGQDPRRYRASLLSTMLGGSSSSRLFQRLREELGLCYSVDFFNIHHRHEGVSGVAMGLSAKTQPRALGEVLAILRDFPDSVTEQELRRAQEQASAGLVMSLESSAARASRAAYRELLYGCVCPVEDSIAAYRAVTLEEIRAFARELLCHGSFALCVLGKCKGKTRKAMENLLE
ncbi:MAG: insulinase family protein [Oscillospiraceae bacterium]|nr:insulinase family protein [Oscillospiraceae bacterium]